MKTLGTFLIVLLIMTVVFAVPFVGISLLWIYLISSFGIPGLLISISATMTLAAGWWVTAEAMERHRNRGW